MGGTEAEGEDPMVGNPRKVGLKVRSGLGPIQDVVGSGRMPTCGPCLWTSVCFQRQSPTSLEMLPEANPFFLQLGWQKRGEQAFQM